MPTGDTLAVFIGEHGYAVLLLATVVEGPIATVLAAYAASLGWLSVPGVLVVAVLGDLLGDLGFYALGRSGHSAWVAWRSEARRRQARRLAVVKRHLRTRPARALLFGKLTHAVGFIVLLAAGAARVPLSRFLLFNLIGAVPKAALFVAVGYFGGAAHAQIAQRFGSAMLWAFPVLLLALGAAVYLGVCRRRLTTRASGA
jgi:membrane protein DedA with SNARE-associated domain